MVWCDMVWYGIVWHPWHGVLWPSCPIIASGVAAVSGVAVSVIITGLVLCVLVLVIVKLRGLCKQVVEGVCCVCMHATCMITASHARCESDGANY